MPEHPEGWKTISIGEIIAKLPKKIQGQVEFILQANISDEAKQKQLLAAMTPYSAQIEAEGFVVGYLVYALPFYVRQALAQQPEEPSEPSARDFFGPDSSN